MKIDRLFAELVYLMNRDVVNARDMAGHFEVSTRTVQRDMDTLLMAGIPVSSYRGAKGGYGIMKEYKLDRQLVNTNDLFFILTSLEGISSALSNREMGTTLDKMRTLARDYQKTEMELQREKFRIDFSAFSIGKNSPHIFDLVRNAIDRNRLIEFNYTSTKFERTKRTIEPMTLIFQWFSWYLYGFCLLRNDYRLFRLSRMEDITALERHFKRREKTIDQYNREMESAAGKYETEIVLKFHPKARVYVEDYLKGDNIEYDRDENIILKLKMPEDDWLYGMILSYGEMVEVLSPLHVRNIILEKSMAITGKYRKLS